MNNTPGNNSNLLTAIVLSVLVLVGYHYFFERPHLQALQAERAAAAASAPAQAPVADVPANKLRAREDIIREGFQKGERIKITTDRLHGSINLRGARLDDLTMADYRESVDAASPEVVLLSPSGTAEPQHAYFAEFGWLADQGVSADQLPSASTIWQASGQQLQVNKPLVLSWDNGSGLVFKREITLDDNYMFTVTDTVTSKDKNVQLHSYGIISRHAHPPAKELYILHEGPLGVFNGTLQEANYADLYEDGTVEVATTAGGWVGVTDKYWLVALVPNQQQPMTARMQAIGAEPAKTEDGKFQIDARGPAQNVAPGESISVTNRLFAGAKEVRLLDAYEEKLGIQRFDLAVDFGWFYFLTKPFFYALDGLARTFQHTGYGFAIAILLFTVALKLLFFPLQNKSYKAMNRMKALQPHMLQLRERYKDDRQKMNIEMFELYRREKVNPMAGCWPVLIQIPVFFALYKVLYVTIEMRHAPFWGWIPDLAAPDPTSLFNLFGLLPFTPPDLLMIGVWPLAMGFTMYLQQKLAPSSPDPIQAAMFKWLPVIFTFMLAHFPAGLVIYWTWSNLLSILQQWVLLKRHAK